MRSSDGTQIFQAQSGPRAAISGRGAGGGTFMRRACACSPVRSGCPRKRVPGSFGRALEAFGVDRIVFETLDSLDPHGVRR